MAAEQKLTLRFDANLSDDTRSPDKQFTLNTLVKLAERGLLDADDDVRLQLPSSADWIHPKEVPEIAAAMERRVSTAQWRRGHAKGAWTVWRKNTEERLTLQQLMDCMQNKRTVTAETLLSAPGRPDEFRMAADWPIFWTKFGTAPWVVRLPDGSEYVANSNDELRQWARAGRVLPMNDVYDINQDDWVQASTVL